MTRLRNLEKLIAESLAEVNQSNEYMLPWFRRRQIYEQFATSATEAESQPWDFGAHDYFLQHGKIRLKLPNFRFCVIAIMSSYETAFLWQKFESHPLYLDTDFERTPKLPVFILDMAKMLICGQIDPKSAWDEWCMRFYEEIGMIAYETTYDVYLSAKSAYDAWLSVFGVYEFAEYLEPHNLSAIDLGHLSENIALHGNQEVNDVIVSAAKAVSVIDASEPGCWVHNALSLSQHYDVQRRLNFWEWWLTEAVPAAWAAVP